MRARELLLEYKREETLARFGQALVDRFHNDQSITADKGRAQINKDFDRTIGSKYKRESPAWNAAARDFYMQRLMLTFETYVHEHKFLPWVVNTYIKGGINSFEDIPKASSFIDQHVALRKNGYFKRHPEANAKYGDLNRFKTLSELGTFVMSVSQDDATSNAEKDRQVEQRMIDEGDAHVMYDDAEWKIVIPFTEEASCHFGRNTQWCTAATKSENMFEHYNEYGNLYIILNKPSNRRWQLHIEACQFMDEMDESVSFDPIAPLIKQGVFDEAISTAKKRGPFTIMVSPGFDRGSIDRLVGMMDQNKLAQLAICERDYTDTKRRPMNSLKPDPRNVQAIYEALMEHSYPAVRATSYPGDLGVKCIEFKSCQDLFFYAFRKNQIHLLSRNDFGGFSYWDLHHFESVMEEMTDCCVFENQRHTMYYGKYDGLVQIAFTGTTTSPSLYWFIDQTQDTNGLEEDERAIAAAMLEYHQSKE